MRDFWLTVNDCSWTGRYVYIYIYRRKVGQCSYRNKTEVTGVVGEKKATKGGEGEIDRERNSSYAFMDGQFYSLPPYISLWESISSI